MEYYGWLLAGAAAGGFVNGLAGFGTALFALGFWLQILPPVQAVSVAVAMSLVSGIPGALLVRHTIKANAVRLGRFVIPGLFGVPVGIALLTTLNPSILKIAIACLLIFYGGFFTIARTLPKFERPAPVGDGLIGFMGGVLGGAASLSGVLPTMWCALRPWTKTEQRAVLQPFNLALLGFAAVGFAWSGYYTQDVLKVIALALPMTMLSSQLGMAIFKFLDDFQFRRLLIGLMLVSGIMIFIREMI
ncbi:MAG: sulfite exporter TauE/SafE family protein [Afipia sp.]